MTNEDKKRFILYARKSSEQEDRQILSVDSQLNELKELAVKNHLNIIETLTESYSAKAPGRPIFNKMIQSIEQGKADAILSWHPDRLSRNTVDSGWLIHLLDQGKLIEIATPSQSFRNTPNDKFLFNLLCSQAKLENDNKSVNVKRGLKAKAEQGWYPGPTSLGYLNNKFKEKGKKTIMIDDERAPLIRKVFDHVLSGKRPLDVLDTANNEWGFKTPSGNHLTRTTFYRLLSDPFYCGEFEYPRGSW